MAAFSVPLHFVEVTTVELEGDFLAPAGTLEARRFAPLLGEC